MLEEKRFRRLGGAKDLPFRARIVAATNRVLQDMVREGGFRADLFYRLNVIPIAIPPLRERREDIPLLAAHFLDHYRVRYHRPDMELSEDTVKVLVNYSWPGNVRELKNLIERLVLLHEGGAITPADLPLEMEMEVACTPGSEGPACLSLDAAVKEAEIRAIRRAFKAASHSKAETARLLQISPRTLRWKLAQLRLKL